jgi:glutathione S-transferase
VKLYQDRRAPNPRRVRIFLAEKGLDAAGLARAGLALEVVDVDISKDEHRAEWFLGKSPLAVVPVLELDDGRTVRESVAICRWFEEAVPTPPLFGADAWSRVQVEQWNRHAELELLVPVAMAFRHGHPFWKGKIEQVPPFGALSRGVVLERMAWLDRELAGRAWLAGDAFSIADITALCALDFAKLSEVRVTAELPNLHRWYQAINARPSARA